MKITWVTFALGWLAILGVPPFSGFWSKDKIIEAAFIGEGWRPWVFGGVALIGAGITAFYMSRLFFMTFHGKKRWVDEHEDAERGVHPHESPPAHDRPDDRARRRLGVPRSRPRRRAACSPLARAGHRRPRRGAPGPRGAGHHGPDAAARRRRRGLAWMRYWRDDVAGRRPARLARSRRRRATTSTRTRSTRPSSCGPASTSPARSSSPTARASTASPAASPRSIGGASSRLRRMQNGFARSYALTMLAGVVAILGALWVMY